MRKALLITIGLSLSGCAEYPGAKTNCWTKSPSARQKAAIPVAYSPTSSPANKGAVSEECNFETMV